MKAPTSQRGRLEKGSHAELTRQTTAFPAEMAVARGAMVDQIGAIGVRISASERKGESETKVELTSSLGANDDHSLSSVELAVLAKLSIHLLRLLLEVAFVDQTLDQAQRLCELVFRLSRGEADVGEEAFLKSITLVGECVYCNMECD